MAAACGGDDEKTSTTTATTRATGGASGGAAQQINVTVQEFSVIPEKTSTKAGKITFNVENKGPTQAHEFPVFKTDLGVDELPTQSDGSLDEEDPALAMIDEILCHASSLVDIEEPSNEQMDAELDRAEAVVDAIWEILAQYATDESAAA